MRRITISAGLDDLAVGQRVEIWATNVATSCPAQAGAEFIEIQT